MELFGTKAYNIGVHQRICMECGEKEDSYHERFGEVLKEIKGYASKQTKTGREKQDEEIQSRLNNWNKKRDEMVGVYNGSLKISETN
ncbi:hypothetical protein KAR91_88405 [Candidatus Pacearchaeota archaeon]|nr:hypothetical protein [Candidatus Pacearchaeota archaeon]